MVLGVEMGSEVWGRVRVRAGFAKE